LGDDNTLDGGASFDGLDGGKGNDVLDGGAGDDFLDGEIGNDVLDGGAGNDFLDGRRGDDTLEGGDDDDRFAFARGYDTDTITDFQDDIDTIELSGFSLGVNTVEEALARATVVNGNTVFTFDTGDVLIVENIADPNLLANDIDIF
jgi:Ca2+-binding RTX toxin-like protein